MSRTTVNAFTAPTRDTHTNWTTNNPVLPEGVMGIVKDRLGEGSLEFVIGDGETAYNDLQKSGEQVSSLETIYDGKDLTTAFADEIAEYSNVWAWIKARIDAQNWDGLMIGDYIPFEFKHTSGPQSMEAQIAGIDTYYGCGASGLEIGHHIDFISRNTYDVTNVRWNFSNSNNGDVNLTVSDAGDTARYPWLYSDIYKTLNEWYSYFPTELQNVIVEKYTTIETRYAADGTPLTEANGNGWMNIGKLWLPSCVEVTGSTGWGTVGYSVGVGIQYPIFMGTKKAWGKTSWGNGGWWTLTPSADSSSNIIAIDYSGSVVSVAASNINQYVPLCFRVA